MPLFGSGNPKADFLVITEAPSLEDANNLILFAGDTGEFFNTLLEGSGIDPENTYRTSLVACPSYTVIEATDDEVERIAYKLPDAESIKTCSPRLNEIIYRIDPRLILAFGTTVWKSLVSLKARGRKSKIEDASGELYDAWIEGREVVTPSAKVPLRRSIRYPLVPFHALDKLIADPSQAEHAPIPSTIRSLERMAEYVRLLKTKPTAS